MLGLIGLSLAVLMVGACANNNNNDNKSNSGSQQVVTRYTVAFEVDGVRYQTLKVKAGEKITDTIPDPYKEGFNFVGWYLGEEKVDFSTYTVTGDVTFVAKFEEAGIDTSLNVNDKKEEGKEYYLVLGWWETTAVDKDTGEPKITSGMTENTVRLFYANLINYLKIAQNATDAQIAAISFRNYSSEKVAEMGKSINTDGDVDIMIGVGNNINSDAGVSLYDHPDYDDDNNYSKFTTPMGAAGKSRYVALLHDASQLGIDTYDWLRGTDAGKKAFVANLTNDEITESLVPETIDLTVTVHGDTNVTTTLDDKNDVITMPEITVPETHNFKGFATTADGEVALDVAKNATLRYDDVKDLVAENAKTLDLYPVFEEKPVVLADLVVYVQVNGTNLTEPEAKLFKARYQAAHPDKNITVNIIDKKADDFKAAVGDDADVLIGGNDPLGKTEKFTPYDAENYPVVNVAAKHFRSTNRKVLIRDTVSPSHLDLAKDLYSFVTKEAPAYGVHATYWVNAEKWGTETERTAIKAGIKTRLETYLSIDTSVEGETLESIYNVSLEQVDLEGSAVATLGEQTRALRDGKGTDLIIGCGGNVDTVPDPEQGTTGASMVIVDKKDIPTTMIAKGRKVALVTENPLARDIYDNYFVAPATE